MPAQGNALGTRLVWFPRITQGVALGWLLPRSQTPFGNALSGETLFRAEGVFFGRARTRLGPADTPAVGNAISLLMALPNGVW